MQRAGKPVSPSMTLCRLEPLPSAATQDYWVPCMSGLPPAKSACRLGCI